MRKGITPIIAIIVLLLITIALAGAAWTFLNTYVGGSIGKDFSVPLTGTCVGGTTAVIKVTNMGTELISLGTCNTNPVTGTSGNCGDITVLRTDSSANMNGSFSASSITAPVGTSLSSVQFTDTNCTTANNPKICSYEFSRAGEFSPKRVSVTCSGT